MTDQGISVQIDQEYKRTPANGLQGITTANYGSYAFIRITNTFQVDDLGITVNLENVNPIIAPSIFNVKYYKMVGRYVLGNIYESFVHIGSPSTPTTVNPNTGHTLINTFVASFWEI